MNTKQNIDRLIDDFIARGQVPVTLYMSNKRRQELRDDIVSTTIVIRDAPIVDRLESYRGCEIVSADVDMAEVYVLGEAIAGSES